MDHGSAVASVDASRVRSRSWARVSTGPRGNAAWRGPWPDRTKIVRGLRPAAATYGFRMWISALNGALLLPGTEGTDPGDVMFKRCVAEAGAELTERA